MAHLRRIVRKCETCGKYATVQLFGMANASYGYFCDRCGPAAERALDARETSQW
jgi:hypothetical protein